MALPASWRSSMALPVPLQLSGSTVVMAGHIGVVGIRAGPMDGARFAADTGGVSSLLAGHSGVPNVTSCAMGAARITTGPVRVANATVGTINGASFAVDTVGVAGVVQDTGGVVGVAAVMTWVSIVAAVGVVAIGGSVAATIWDGAEGDVRSRGSGSYTSLRSYCTYDRV